MHTSGLSFLHPYNILKRAGLAPGWHMLDVGCGALGHFTFPASELVGPLGRVYALDVHRKSVEAVRRAAKESQRWNVHSIWSDAERFQATQLNSGIAHLSLLSNILHLVRDRAGLWNETMRLTKPGGLILVVEWTDRMAPFGPPEEARLAPERIQRDAEALGLALADQFDAGEYHQACLFRLSEKEPEPTVFSLSQPFLPHA